MFLTNGVIDSKTKEVVKETIGGLLFKVPLKGYDRVKLFLVLFVLCLLSILDLSVSSSHEGNDANAVIEHIVPAFRGLLAELLHVCLGTICEGQHWHFYVQTT